MMRNTGVKAGWVMVRQIRAMGLVLMVLGLGIAGIAPPALAQSYGYGPPPPPPPVYRPPGSRCEAMIRDSYNRRVRFICPMRASKPVGAPCRCVPAPVPGYPAGPVVRGWVTP